MHILSILFFIALGIVLSFFVARIIVHEFWTPISIVLTFAFFSVGVPIYIGAGETATIIVDSRSNEAIVKKKVHDQNVKVFDFNGKPMPFTKDKFLIETFVNKMGHDHAPDIRVVENSENDSMAYVYSLRVVDPFGFTKRREFIVSNDKIHSFEIAISMDDIKKENVK